MFATGIGIFRPKINCMWGTQSTLMGPLCSRYRSIPESEGVSVCLDSVVDKTMLPCPEAEPVESLGVMDCVGLVKRPDMEWPLKLVAAFVDETLYILVAGSVKVVLGTVIVDELVFVVLPEKLLGIKCGSDGWDFNELRVTSFSSNVDGNNLTEVPLASDDVADGTSIGTWDELESPLAFVDWYVEEVTRTPIIDDLVCIGLPSLMLLFDVTPVKLLFVNWSVEEVTRTVVIDDLVCTGLLSLMLLFDVTVKLLFVNWSVEEVTRMVVIDDPVCTEVLSFFVFGDADVVAAAEATFEVSFEDPFTTVIWVIIRVIWRIRNDECILIIRKACGKRDKRGFAQLATEEIKQIARYALESIIITPSSIQCLFYCFL